MANSFLTTKTHTQYVHTPGTLTYPRVLPEISGAEARVPLVISAAATVVASLLCCLKIDHWHWVAFISRMH